MKTKKLIKTIRILLLIILVVAVALGAMIIMKMRRADESVDNPFVGMEGMNFDSTTLSEMVSAYGVTSIGTTEEAFPIEALTTRLEVEEVYVASGDTITAETAVLKFTESSIAEAREELETALREADLAYRAGKIEYEQAVISAKYEYETTVLNGNYAAAVYEENISNMEENVEKAREAYEEAKQQIAEYESGIADGTFQKNLEACQAEYDENLALLVKYIEEWDVSWTEVTSGGMSMGTSGGSMTGGMSGGDMPSGDMSRSAMSGGNSLHAQYVSILQDLYGVLETNAKDLEEAEETLENASFHLQTLQLSLPELDEAYASAQANYETSLIQAKLTKETTLTEAELAQKNYETSLEKAQSDFEALEDAKLEAEENLAVFEAQMGSGYYYPLETGTVLRISVRAGRELSGGSSVLTIRNSEEMTVTVSVDQADIAKLAVGDTAMVYSGETGTYEGVVLSINPVSGSTSRSSITYSVTVELTGNTSKLSTNETVTVYFMTGGRSDEA